MDQRMLKPQLEAEGAEAQGVWDREVLGHVVQR